MVLKVCFANPKGFATISQGIRGCISVMASLKFTSFFKINDVLLQIIAELL
jgi:hypothetical protein